MDRVEFKVLILAYYFPPMGMSGVQRTLKYAKFMSRYNWKPTVITTGKTAYFAHDMSLMKEAEDADIRIMRTEAMDPNSLLSRYGTLKMPNEKFRKFLSAVSKTLFIPDNKVSWANRAYNTARELLKREKFDIIFVSLPPFSPFIAAAKLKKEFDIPLFVDYRDLWYGNHFAYYPTFYHRSRHKALESGALRQADKIIAVNRKIKEKLILTYNFLNYEDILIFPHGYDPEDFEKISLEKRENSNTKMRITYSGIFYENVTPVYFLKAFKKLTEIRPDAASNIELHFVGHLRTENEKLIAKLKLKQYVIYHGYLDHHDSLEKVMNSDILWMMLGKKTEMENVSAGKLFEYFGTRKPIIACVGDGASKTAAVEYGASFITEPDDINQICDTILNVYNLYQKKELPEANEEFIIQHNRKDLTQKLTTHFQFYLKEEI